MTGLELNAIYGAMISPDALVDVPVAWMPAVHEAMQAFADLPTDVRMFYIVVGIGRDAEGDLAFSIASAVEYISSDGMKQVRAIIEQALATCSAIPECVH
jgi:hypothetical protein